MEKWFNVGKIVNTHGVKGELRIISSTDFPEERYRKGNVLSLFLEKEEISLTVSSYRRHKNFDLLTFEGYENINDVERFKGGTLKVTEDQLSELEEGSFYFHEIIGCNVTTTSGEEIGEVKEILAPGANDVWVVKGNKGEFLIPYIEDIVVSIDVEKKQIVIEPMEGLLS
ncbi:ribosome maturation factor RimM [Bacillus sp. 2205SS5-2]|uniref:ribosome maturation factor RimM n=1 Tax=Bacillus sp. 2205SS5-2 TaxID=3109031 RepID=UPI0030070102